MRRQQQQQQQQHYYQRYHQYGFYLPRGFLSNFTNEGNNHNDDENLVEQVMQDLRGVGDSGGGGGGEVNERRSSVLLLKAFYCLIILGLVIWFVKSQQRFHGQIRTPVVKDQNEDETEATNPREDNVKLTTSNSDWRDEEEGAPLVRVTHQMIGAFTSSDLLFWVRTSEECLVRLTIIEERRESFNNNLKVSLDSAVFVSEKKVAKSELDFTLTFAVPLETFHDDSQSFVSSSRSFSYYFTLNGRMDTSSVSSVRIPSFLVRERSSNDDGGSVAFVAGSCLYSNYKPFTIFRHVLRSNPDFVLYMGDQVSNRFTLELFAYITLPFVKIYADYPKLIETKEQYEDKYKDNFGDVELKQTLGRIPSFMIWDDHELINNYDAGNDTALYQIAKSVYDEYVTSHNPIPRVQQQLYYSFKIPHKRGVDGGEEEDSHHDLLDFYVLDLRSHRSRTNVSHSDPLKTMLGASQKSDLKLWLSHSTATFKGIALLSFCDKKPSLK